MSKVKIQGNASGTGVLTVEAPNTNTDRTITLPDSTGTLLTTDGDGSSLTGLTSAQMPAGSVLQVVSATDGTNLSTNAGSPVVGHTVSITPIASTSKILVLASLAAESMGSASDRGIGLRLYRDETVLVNYVYNHYMSGDTTQRIGAVSFHVYDYPATAGTLSYSYKYVNTGGTSSTARMNYYGDSIITLMEIAQ